MPVGSSKNRTLGKHVLLNKLVGREAGMLVIGKLGSTMRRQYTILDLCAGDGLPSYHSKISSPQILSKHLAFMKDRNVKCDAFFIEKDPITFATLSSGFKNALNINALDMCRFPNNPPENSIAFIHSDPNSIKDWPLTRKLLESAPIYTTTLTTLGCNVGGLKRLSIEKRREWYDHVEDILTWLPEWHDAMLVSLRGDDAQWAYLITGPTKWMETGRYGEDVDNAFLYWQIGAKKGHDRARYREAGGAFSKLIDTLFLTKKERSCQ